ncbi:hypothetical protein [uncultured Flavobacterium sp.]|uniref:hypothetical protein n=1 Tax=uncultured Flavobacterium sp. TaxID=165435 RepID=UPI0025CCA12B|nr:hypothetical protein [uncultured Flavobacterium sp.]
MNAIDEVFSIMSIEDKQGFKSYLSKKNKRQDVQNISFFKFLETDDINVFKNKYKDKKSADAYHALRKRVYDSLIEFMANRSFENITSVEHEVLRLLVVGRVFLEHKLYKTAFKCLAKAEVKALSLEHFNLLNEIYNTQIQYAHINESISLDVLIEKHKTNRERLYKEEQLNLGYAILRRELAAIYHEGKVVDFRSLIKSTMESLAISFEEVLTFKSLYQMLFIANEYASINSNFGLIEPFVEKSFAFISHKKELGEKHLYYHIYILYFIANIHFRNHRFKTSLEYLARMNEQMQLQGGKYKKRFSLRWSLLLALNEHYSGSPEKAIDIAQKAMTSQKGADPVDVNDLNISLAGFYLQKGDKAVFKCMRQFTHTDGWYEKRMGKDWAIKKVLLEIVMHIEFDDSEQALYRIKAFKRRYKKYLSEVKENRVLDYVQLIEKYILNPNSSVTAVFKNKLHTLTNEVQTSQDVFVLSFMGWLTAKVERKPVYETILSLLK